MLPNARPDLSRRLSCCKLEFPYIATVQDLSNGNKLFHDAKRFSEVRIRYTKSNLCHFQMQFSPLDRRDIPKRDV